MELLQTASSRVEPTKRGTLFCEIEIESQTSGQIIPGGFVVNEGVHRVRIRETDLPVVLAMVEPELNVIAEAQARCDQKREMWIAEKVGDLQGHDREVLAEELRATFVSSIPACFRELKFRDMKPFLRVTTIRGELPSTDDEERMAQEVAQARNLQAAAGAVNAPHVDMQKMIDSAVAAATSGIQAKIDAAVEKALEEDRATRPAAKPTK